MGVGAFLGWQSISEAELGLDQGLLPPKLGPFTVPFFSMSSSEKENPRRRQGQLEHMEWDLPHRSMFI